MNFNILPDRIYNTMYININAFSKNQLFNFHKDVFIIIDA